MSSVGPERSWGARLARGGVWIAGAAAIVTGLPGLGFPFLSDDWLLLQQVSGGAPPATAYDYFRPLYMASFWVDRRIWGPSPFFFHLTNILLIAACAMLVTLLARHYTRDAPVAALAGLFFALHPYHVENAAWVAVRGDPLYGVLVLLAIWAYERWRRRSIPDTSRERAASAGSGAHEASSGIGGREVSAGRSDLDASAESGAREVSAGIGNRELSAGSGDLEASAESGMIAHRSPGSPRVPRPRFVPVGALLLFEAALLAKETAVILPVLLAALVFMVRGRPGLKREWIRGLAPITALALAHIFIVRPLVLHGQGRSLTPGAVGGWIRHALGFAVAAILPVDGEILAAQPYLWGALALLALALLVSLALRRVGRIPGLALAAAILFAILLAPSIIGFQERYLFLPAAASGLMLASLARASGGWPARTVVAVILAGWLLGTMGHWQNWGAAARASRSLVRGLVASSRRPGVEEVVIANAPFRVRGGSVAGDFAAAVAQSGGRSIPVRAACYVSYPAAESPAFIDRVSADRVSGDRVLVDRPSGDRASSGEPPASHEGSSRPQRAPVLELLSSFDPIAVRLRVPEGPFCHIVGPMPSTGATEVEGPSGRLLFEGSGAVRIQVPLVPGREVLGWYGGELHSLVRNPGESQPAPAR